MKEFWVVNIMKSYTHLRLTERQLIYSWFHCGNESIREIARRLSRSHSTISREIKRNITDYYVPTYYPNPAHAMYEWRIKSRSQRLLLKNNDTRKYVIKKIKLGWTPQLISGRIKLEGDLVPVSHEAIYQFIYKEQKDLIAYLPRKHKNRRNKYPSRKYVTKTSQKVSILDRPENINNRLIPGHWETDSVESKHRNGGLNVIVERVSRLVKISKLSSKKAKATTHSIVNKLSDFPSSFIQSITYDNGNENAEHLLINRILGCKSYFCQPYHSWEKGAVEQVNGLIRRYLPKGTDMKLVHPSSIRKIENLLNNRPRRCLGYKTPYEVYDEIISGALLF